MRVTIVGAERWNYTKADTGEVKRGARCHYLAQGFENVNRLGYEVVSSSMPFEAFDKLVAVPGVYEVVVDVRPDRRGMAVVTVRDLQFVEEVALPV